MARQNVTEKSDLIPPDSPPRTHVVPSQSQIHFKDMLKQKLNSLVYLIFVISFFAT